MGTNREADDGPSPNTAEATRGTQRFHRLVPRSTPLKVHIILIGLAAARLLGLALNHPSLDETSSSLYASFWDPASIAEPPSYVARLIQTIQQKKERCLADENDYEFIRCKDHSRFLSECQGLLNLMMKNQSNDIVTLLPLVDEHERRNITLGETVVHPAEKPHLLAGLLDSNTVNWADIDAVNITRTAEPFVWMPEIYTINNPSVLVVSGGAYFELFTGRIQKCDSPGSNMNLLFQFANCGEFPPTPFVHSNSSNLSTIPSYTTAVFLSSPNDGFFHQMVEKLPQAVLLHDFLAQHTDITIVLKGTFNNRVEQTLLDPLQQLLGYAINIDVIDYTKHPIVYADTIVVPEPTFCGCLQPVIARATRALIRQRLAVVAAVQKKNTYAMTTVDKQQPYILVVRRRRTRFIANHKELLGALTQALPHENFVIYDEAKVPSAGIPQWSLFANSKLIVAPHGAALSNLLAAGPGTVVVEFLAHSREFNLAFATLSTSLGLQYHPLSMDLIDIIDNKFSRYHVNVTRTTAIIVEIVEQLNRS